MFAVRKYAARLGNTEMDKTFCVWVWESGRWILLQCKEVTSTQAAAMLLLSDRPLLFLRKGDEPPLVSG